MSTAWLQAQNNSHDVLAADVLTGDATIEVTTAATQFPAAYPYRVTVWDAATHTDPGDDPDMEIMQVTGRAGNVLSVTRAQEGTAAAAHTAGDVVRLLVTAGMVQQVQDTIAAHDHSAAGDGGTVDHTELSSIGSNTHAQIDTHIGSTANPHGVTAGQTGAPTTGDLSAHTGAANPHSGSASTGDLTAHTGDTANPHSVTAAQVGAATVGDLSAHVGNVSNPHAVTAAQAGAPTIGDLTAHTGAANPHSGSASTGDLTAHTGDTANPHSVTAAQAGAPTIGDLTAHTGAANPHSGSASTGDLTTHTGDTANPHSVTAAQVGKDTAQWNADEVQNVAVDDTAIADGYVLKYDAVAGTLVYAADDDTTDHGALSGLGDDDHAQYHTDARALAWLGTRSTTDLPEGTGLYHTTARARAAVSATTPLAYDSNTGVLSIQAASAAQAGYLSAADWTTFNDKQAALALPLTHENGGLEADVSAYDGLVKITGGATSAVTDNSADWNTAAGLAHAAVTVADTTSVDLTLVGQQVSAAVIPAGVDHDALQNTHNLTTDIDHNALLNYAADRHYLQADIEAVDTDLATGLLKVTTGTGALSSITDSSANWDAAYSHVSASGASHTYIDQAVTIAGTPQFAKLGLGAAAGTARLTFPAATTPAGGIDFGGDATLYRSAANVLSTDDSLSVALGAVINEGGGDYDTRIEGAGDANLIYVDAGNDRVGIGTATPPAKLSLAEGTTAASGIALGTDVSLYRSAADILKTDDGFWAARAGVGVAPAARTTLGITETFTQQVGTTNGIDVATTLSPAGALSGATYMRALSLLARWNSAVDGGTYGTVYGIEVLPQTLRAASGNLLRASGVRACVLHYGSGNVGTAYGVYSLIRNDDSSGTNEVGDITNAYNYWAAAYTNKGTGSIVTRYGLYVADVSGGGVCGTQYGLYVEALSGATTNVAAYLGGDVQIAGGLDVASTTKAFLPPRMTTTQRDAIASPVAGMVIYNSTTNVLNFYNGSGWGAV